MDVTEVTGGDSTEADDPDSSPVQDSSPMQNSSQSFLWKHLFPTSESLSCELAPPSFLPDGTPIVSIPPDILLKSSTAWKDYLICSFCGTPPSPNKVFSDLNPIWGKRGNITVHRFAGDSYLIFVPSPVTRKWILNVGLWSSGTVAFVVSEWTATATFQSHRLSSVPAWLTLRDVPPQLWSGEGLRLLARGVGNPLPGNHNFSLPPTSMGVGKIRTIINLSSPRPSSILARDKEGNSVRVSVDYGRLPVLCSSCSNFGHPSTRCPSRQKSAAPSSTHAALGKNTANPTVDDAPPASSDQTSPSLDPAQPFVKETSVQDGGGLNFKNPNSPINDLSPLTKEPNPQTDPLKHINSVQPTKENSSITICPLEDLGHVHSPKDPSFSPVSPPTIIPPIPNAANCSSENSDPLPLSAQAPDQSVEPHLNTPAGNSSLLVSQIHAGITAALGTPRPTTPINSHIYFTTPSTNSTPKPESPPSVSLESQSFINHQQSIKEKGGKNKKVPPLSAEEEESQAIAQILNSPQWQKGYRYAT